MAAANTIAYDDTATITTIKDFIVQALMANVIQLFTDVSLTFHNKLERLSLTSLSSLA
jgi:hypothetical protein